MTIHLITFAAGNSNIKKAAHRLIKQSKTFFEIETRKIFTEEDLEDHDYINLFNEKIRKNNKGFGLWSWKPFLISKYFKKINDDDILIYLDAGFEINSKGHTRFKEYIEQVNIKGNLFFEIDHKYINWTKKNNLFELENFKNKNLILAGCLILKKNKANENILDEWLKICSHNQGELLCDPDNKLSQNPEFIEHRHDLSALSLVLYKNKHNKIKDETWNQYWFKLRNMPFLAMRSRDENTQLNEINKYYYFKRCKKNLKKYIKRSYKLLIFLIYEKFNNLTIKDVPSFRTNEEINWFIESIKKCNFYIEFGSGGTTIQAAKHNVKMISIESDRYFQKNIIRTLKKLKIYDENKQTFVYRNIGVTKEWGYPLFKKFSSEYSRIDDILVHNIYPDLILIDGRYRVACVINILINFSNIKNEVILAVDDYKDRNHYHILEKFINVKQYIDDIAIFNLSNINCENELEKYLQIYRGDPR